MSCPANTGKVINYVKHRETTIDNDTLIKLAGGSLAQWEPSLRGAKAQAIVNAVNSLLTVDDFQLSSEGVGTEKWQLVTVSEAHRRKVAWNLDRMDGPYVRIHDAVVAIVNDIRTPKRLKKHAKAWLELMEEPRTNGKLHQS